MRFFFKKQKKRPTNHALNELFEGIDLIQIKKSGVAENAAIFDEVVLQVDDPTKIQAFNQYIAINEPKEEFYCACLGDYAIELFYQKELKATIGFHHGVSIRYYQWLGDAELKYPNELLEFLADLGLKEPLEQKTIEAQRVLESAQEDENWLKNSPQSFFKYWQEINGFDESYLPALKNDLAKEFNQDNSLILALLKSFGTSNNLWTAYAMYEDISKKLLDDFDFQSIIDAFVASDQDQVICIGLGRYLFSWGAKNEIAQRKKLLSTEVLEILSKAFEAINDTKVPEAVEKIKNK